jgi:hypothetical protein
MKMMVIFKGYAKFAKTFPKCLEYPDVPEFNSGTSGQPARAYPNNESKNSLLKTPGDSESPGVFAAHHFTAEFKMTGVQALACQYLPDCWQR